MKSNGLIMGVFAPHKNLFKCVVCDTMITSATGSNARDHIAGKKHQSKVAGRRSAPAPVRLPVPQTVNVAAPVSGGAFGSASASSHARPHPPAQAHSVELVDVDGPEMSLAEMIAADDDAMSAAARRDTNGGDDNNGDNQSASSSLDDDPPGPFDTLASTYFQHEAVRGDWGGVRTTLYSGDVSAPRGVELGLIGHLAGRTGVASQLCLNVSDPFCLIAVGVQGSGKSHTMNCILEACLLSCPPITHVRQPMSVMVCHYDRSDVNCCEATGLGQPSREIAALLHNMQSPTPAPSLAKSDVLVLCSPSFYKQRREYYDGICEVRPLLFRWSRLKAQQIKMLMKLDESAPQLYVALMLDVLRGYQRKAKLPAFRDFVREFEAMCSGPSQSSPLKQRFQLLASFVYESDVNEPLRDVGADLADVMAAGRLVVVDLTDPMMSPADANCIFQVVLDTFRCKQLRGCGKVVAFDEAHRYMGMQGTGDALAMEITDCARLMRHEGLRVLISTQSPKAMPEELLELTSVLVAHRFQSVDWHHHLARKLPLPEDSFVRIRALDTGEALVYSARPRVGEGDEDGDDEEREVLRVQVRKRLTADRGASRRNRASQPEA
eukprot:m.72616 g.72616  ORF g.72616 m.72616 type:complete len:607 (-) comp8793_c1_seq1:396-2216(-)